ncbi:hypothetical protein K3162_09905 [Qipengyuania xiapuensis]|uniref:Uncharacterized protein n=1 Tax=Qipengyuania xiapuensis TaxID=2867236 RepID=A0ABX8ZS91_9SPHN|nr:hypothetical protein [Qipengyuania xiapuensis]QZD91865.1 hypothetical protein K3162_09905 [Qipengyuania xiapuensis]
MMDKMAAGTSLISPFTLIFLSLAISPVGYVAYLGLTSRVWLLTLIPLLSYGIYATYNMGFVSASSTSALGLIFIPMIQWAFVGLVLIVKSFAKA